MHSTKIRSKFHRILHPGDRISTNQIETPSRSSRNSSLQDDFPYDTLEPCNVFRLLTLLPGSGDDEVECELSTHRMDFIPGSEASDHNLSER